MRSPVPWFVVLLGVVHAAVAAEPPCLLPLAIPDRWADADGNGRYDAGELYDPDLTGYGAATDTGLAISATPANPATPVAMETYFIVALPPLGRDTEPQTGGTWLRQRVSTCTQEVLGDGDSLLIEPGNLLEALQEELQQRIAQDPAAHWDADSASVQGSAFPTSPRLVALPCFDPLFPPTSAPPRLRIRKLAVFFLESAEAPVTIHLRLTGDLVPPVSIQSTSWSGIKSLFGVSP